VSLHLGRRARQLLDVVVEVDEGGLAVGLGVVEDAAEGGVGGVVGGGGRDARDAGDPGREGVLDGGAGGVELGAVDGCFERVSGFLGGVEQALHGEEVREPVDYGPEVRGHAEQRVDGTQGRGRGAGAHGKGHEGWRIGGVG